MLGNLILETTTAPGTSADCNLNGPVAGRLNFGFWFASGAQCFYVMNDGVQQEWGIGTYTAGSPNKINRTTVLKNSAGTTARLNFLGTTRVYNDIPAEKSLWVDASGNATVPGTIIAQAVTASSTGGTPKLLLQDPSSAVDAKNFDFQIVSGSLFLRAVNDAYTQANSWLTVARTGYTITAVSIAGTQINLQGNTSVTGALGVSGAATVGGTLNVAGAAAASTVTASANGMYLATGSYWSGDGSYTYWAGDAGNWRWQYNRASGAMIWVRGYDSASLLTIDASGGVSLPATLTANAIMSNSGAFYIGGSFAHYLARNPSDGAWRFVENGTVNATLDTAGTFTTRGSVSAAGSLASGSTGVFVGVGGFQLYDVGPRVIKFADQWTLQWDNTNGNLTYFNPGTAGFSFRTSDGWYIDWRGPMAGNGAYQNISDERIKTEITEASHGLDHILALRPITFRRLDHKGVARERGELGFSAQQLREVLPEAVSPIGTIDPKAPGSLDSGDPILAMSIEPIVAALVNGMRTQAKEIASLKARLAALEPPRP